MVEFFQNLDKYVAVSCPIHRFIQRSVHHVRCPNVESIIPARRRILNEGINRP